MFYFGEALAPVTDTRQIRADTATIADATLADSARTGCLQQTLSEVGEFNRKGSALGRLQAWRPQRWLRLQQPSTTEQ